MKNNFDKKKSADTLVTLAQNASKISKKVAIGVKNNALAVVEKTKSESYARRLKKYNPLFPDQYHSEAFNLPNIIVIVDDAVRKDIDVCAGAIGWLGKENGVEVLYLYDEAVPFSGIQFIPTATCDAVYYVDSFDRNSFIKADCIFNKVQEERSAELEHIACCLGAKRCSIEIIESQTTAHEKKNKTEFTESVKGVNSNESTEQSSTMNSITKLRTQNYTEFQGNTVPQMPTLKWFAHDNTIKQLIASRCNGDNSVKEKTLKFFGSSFATMSKKAACAIDCVLSVAGNAKYSTSMQDQATREQESSLIFHIEF